MLLYSVLFISGACFGSFFLALSFRLISDSFKNSPAAILYTPSACPECGARIKPVHLIPIAGYFLSNGKCDSCGCGIDPVHPGFEILSGLLFCAVIYSRGLSIPNVFDYFALLAVISAAAADFRTMRIPGIMSLMCLVFAIYPVFLSGTWIEALAGAAVSGGFLLIVALIFPGGFGGGDIKLAAAAGFFLGTELSIVSMESALVVGSITGIAYALITKQGLRIKIPFAPFIASGVLISYFFGRMILSVYYSI